MLRLRCGTGVVSVIAASRRLYGGCRPVDPVGEITQGVGEGVGGAGAGETCCRRTIGSPSARP
jgi:hypothetical protein